MKLVAVLLAMDKVPVAEFKDNTPALPTVLTVLVRPLLKVRTFSLLLKFDQSVDESNPLLDAEAEGRLKVWVPPDEEMEKSVPAVDEASNCVASAKPFNEVMPPPGGAVTVSQEIP